MPLDYTFIENEEKTLSANGGIMSKSKFTETGMTLNQSAFRNVRGENEMHKTSVMGEDNNYVKF